MKKIWKKIGITVSILLLTIGGVYAGNGTEDSSNVPIEDTPNISIGDINGSNAKEDIALEEGGAVKEYIALEEGAVKENITGNTFGEEGGITEKKSSSGFGFIITAIILLSAVIVIIRRR